MPPPTASGTEGPAAFESFHAWLRSLPDGAERIAAHAFLPPRSGRQGVEVAAPYRSWLQRLNLTPWRHQAIALNHLADGRDVVLATPTASGKSLAYQLPALHAADAERTALLVFPTKALANDQWAALCAMAASAGLDLPEGGIARYDGDTPRQARRRLREGASVVLTNPDMLHLGILPFHAGWASFLARLDVVVIDELHAYRGVLGSHVAGVLRRLLRLAAHYGARPRVVAASATIANPAALYRALSGRDAEIVTEDDAPHGPREVVFWEPPARPGGDGRRRSPVAEAADLAATFVRTGVKSLFFCNSRKAAELVRRYAAAHLSDAEARTIDAYRAGYDASERSAIEAAFRRGEVRVLVSTSAMELGVDVGGVDAVVMVGYPGSVMSFWQRAGRAGRGGARSLTLLVPGDDPLDDHYLRHPHQVTDGSVEAAVADPHNEVIHPEHVVCAAAERPVDPAEDWLRPGLDLEAVPGLYALGSRYASVRRFPQRRVSLRGGEGRRVRLVEASSGRSLGHADAGRAVRELHPGAVHLYRGEPYLVVDLDLEAATATLVPHIEDWYTQVRGDTRVEILDDAEGGATGRRVAELLSLPPGVRVGRVRVVEAVSSYVRKRYRTEAILEEVPLDLPESSYLTRAMWTTFTPEATAGVLPAGSLPAAMHALEHTMIGLLPAFVLCERADVGGVSYPLHPQLAEPAMFVYDGAPGGVGYAEAGASQLPRWLAAAHARLRDCPCRTGCPRCILSPKCGNGNQYLDKAAAFALADAWADRLAEGAAAVVRA